MVWRDGGWPGSCHEHELLVLSGLWRAAGTAGVTNLIDREFRGWPPSVRAGTRRGDRRTKDRLNAGQRAFNRCQAGLRALVEQAIGRLANAWALRRWRGLLDRQ